MKKLLIAPMLSLLITACSTSPKQELMVDCVFADGSNAPAPSWVCGAPIDDVEILAVGYAEKSGGGVNMMKQMAMTAARVEIAQTVKVNVSNMIKQFAETTGSGDSETVDLVNTSVSKQITSEMLVGSKIYRQMPTPSGGMVVGVGISKENLKKISTSAINSSMKNDKALWQKFQAEKSQEELNLEIQKII